MRRALIFLDANDINTFGQKGRQFFAVFQAKMGRHPVGHTTPGTCNKNRPSKQFVLMTDKQDDNILAITAISSNIYYEARGLP
jgi:hypothetical protein